MVLPYGFALGRSNNPTHQSTPTMVQYVPKQQAVYSLFGYNLNSSTKVCKPLEYTASNTEFPLYSSFQLLTGGGGWTVAVDAYTTTKTCVVLQQRHASAINRRSQSSSICLGFSRLVRGWTEIWYMHASILDISCSPNKGRVYELVTTYSCTSRARDVATTQLPVCLNQSVLNTTALHCRSNNRVA